MITITTIPDVYLKQIPEADIVVEMLTSKPEDRIKIINRYAGPYDDCESALVISSFMNAALAAWRYIDGKEPLEWNKNEESAYCFLYRLTGLCP